MIVPYVTREDLAKLGLPTLPSDDELIVKLEEAHRALSAEQDPVVARKIRDAVIEQLINPPRQETVVTFEPEYDPKACGRSLWKFSAG